MSNITNQPKIISCIEYVTSKPSAVDAEAGVVRGVKVLGYESKNGRVYDKTAARRAMGLYEGRSVYFDHSANPSATRSMSDKGGVIRNVSEREDGLYGDLHLLKSHPNTARVLEAAEKMPEAFGLSHNVDGRTAKRNGRAVVEEIVKVRSVDVVSEPATTNGLFESINGDEPAEADPAENGKQHEAKPMSEEIREAVEAATAAQSKAVAELQEQVKELTGHLNAERAAKKALETENVCRSLLESCGVDAKPFMLHALALIEDEAERKELAESWKPAAKAELPRSAASGSATTSGGYKRPENAKEFAARLR